jgi:hypothetical protein
MNRPDRIRPLPADATVEEIQAEVQLELAIMAAELQDVRDKGRRIAGLVLAIHFEDDDTVEVLGAGDAVELLELALDTFEAHNG